jgi:hypothetical protein
MRQVIEQYHYLYLLDQEKWMGVGLDGLIEHTAIQFNNIGAILHGRTQTTDHFFELRQGIRQDPDIIGGISAADEELFHAEHLAYFGNVRRNHALDSRETAYFEDGFSNYARHRPHLPEFMEPTHWGEDREFPAWEH